MSIYYQGIAGAYSHIASKIAQDQYLQNKKTDIIGLSTFDEVRESIKVGDLAVLPVENSYAGSIHTNLYNFLKYDFVVLGDIYLPIDHQLLATHGDLSKIKFAYSHPQALAQCHKFLEKNNIKPIEHIDTSISAQFVSQQNNPEYSAIASSLAGDLHDLQTIQSGIQDQKGNTTRFLVVTTRNNHFTTTPIKIKTSIIFQVNHIPSALYKCLGAFATNNINLTKIESLPSYQDKFHYFFWLDFEGNLEDKKVQSALEELKFFTNDVKILGEY